MVKKFDYFESKNESNKILDLNTSYDYQAISRLHVIKNHSEYFSNFQKKKNIINKIFKAFYYFFREKNLFYLDLKPSSIDCLILSNIIEYKKNHQFKDNYFGGLDQELKKSNVTVIKVYKNLSNFSSYEIFKDQQFKKNILLSKSSGFAKEITYILKIIKSYFFLKIIKKNKFISKLFAISDFLTISSNLRIGDQILELLKNFKPKILIFTYEGHAWERIMINKIKKNFSDIKIAGYQFTALIKEQNSIYRNVTKDFMPDIVFSTGKKAKEILLKNSPKLNVKVLGSTKKFKILRKRIYKPQNLNSNVLFVPEGLIEESYKMLNFCIDSAKKNKDKNFYFRFHPLIAAKKFMDEFNFNYYFENLNNLFLSSNELEKDIAKSEYIVFRGSSVVFNACINDKTPLYLNIDKFQCNPLYEVFPKKLIIRNILDFVNISRDLISFNERRKLKKYCLRYFEKINPAIINQYL
jgi:hypothetical protein